MGLIKVDRRRSGASVENHTAIVAELFRQTEVPVEVAGSLEPEGQFPDFPVDRLDWQVLPLAPARESEVHRRQRAEELKARFVLDRCIW